MNLRSLAHSDLIDIMHDTHGGSWPFTITSPGGVTVSFLGWANDIHLSIDPGTDEIVTGRQATVSPMIHDLNIAGFGEIKGVAESDSKPWIVEIDDINGKHGVFKVTSANPDAGIGLTVLFLEEYTK
jgi:hypothetical protein